MPFRLPVRFGRRLPQLLVGLVLYGWSMAMLIRSGLGLDPWDVFHQGLANHLPITFGQVTILVGALVLLLWIPLRQRPGIGTVLNVFVIGLAADAGLAAMPAVTGLPGQIAMLLGGVVANGLAGALYVGARLGPGPRDGLWVALTKRTGHSIRVVRTVLEVTIVAIGWLLGGVVGVGTRGLRPCDRPDRPVLHALGRGAAGRCGSAPRAVLSDVVIPDLD